MNVEEEVNMLKGLSAEIISTLAVCCPDRPKPVDMILIETEAIDPIHWPDAFHRHASFLLKWEARKPLVMSFPLTCRIHHDLVADKVKAEVGALLWAKNNTQLPIPRVRAYDPRGTHRGNATRRPFILHDHMPGKHITNKDWERMTNEQKYKVVGSVAKIVAEISIHPFDKIGSLYPEEQTPGVNVAVGPLLSYPVARYSILHDPNRKSSQLARMFRASHSPYVSAMDYMIDTSNKHLLHRALASPVPSNQFLELWIYRSLIPSLVLDDYNRGPFVVRHGLLDRQALLFDEDYQLTGVIGWEFTHTAPLQIAALHPPFFGNLPMSWEEPLFQYLRAHYVAGLAHY